MDDVDALLDLAARIWLRTHPDEEPPDTGSYTTAGNGFLSRAEAAFFAAART